MTNLDRIKSMTVDELVELFDTAACKKCDFRGQRRCAFKDCKDGIKKWLEQAAAE